MLNDILQILNLCLNNIWSYLGVTIWLLILRGDAKKIFAVIKDKKDQVKNAFQKNWTKNQKGEK